jgi:hypothetical protein
MPSFVHVNSAMATLQTAPEGRPELSLEESQMSRVKFGWNIS